MTTPVTASDHVKSIVNNRARKDEAIKSTVDAASAVLDARAIADKARRDGR